MKKAVAEELAPSSSTNYTRSWRRFISFCESNDLLHLPAKADTVALYFGHLATFNSYSSILNARAAIRHFHVLKFPKYLPPTDFEKVHKVVAGLRRSLKPTPKPKRGFTPQKLDECLSYFLSGGLENCSLLDLRNAAFFSLLYNVSARFSDICGMKLGHVATSGDTLVVGFGKLKNDKSNSSFSSLVAERFSNPFSCYKLITRLKERRLSDGASKLSFLFPLMKNTRVLGSHVSYGAMRTVFTKMLSSLDFAEEDVKSLGLHSFRIGAISVALESGKVSREEMQQAGRWKSSEMIEHYNRPSKSSRLNFSKNI